MKSVLVLVFAIIALLLSITALIPKDVFKWFNLRGELYRKTNWEIYC